jgi:hypothetical protein
VKPSSSCSSPSKYFTRTPDSELERLDRLQVAGKLGGVAANRTGLNSGRSFAAVAFSRVSRQDISPLLGKSDRLASSQPGWSAGMCSNDQGPRIWEQDIVSLL